MDRQTCIKPLPTCSYKQKEKINWPTSWISTPHKSPSCPSTQRPNSQSTDDLTKMYLWQTRWFLKFRLQVFKMADGGFDPCECIWNHENAMQRLMNLVSSHMRVNESVSNYAQWYFTWYHFFRCSIDNQISTFQLRNSQNTCTDNQCMQDCKYYSFSVPLL